MWHQLCLHYQLSAGRYIPFTEAQRMSFDLKLDEATKLVEQYDLQSFANEDWTQKQTRVFLSPSTFGKTKNAFEELEADPTHPQATPAEAATRFLAENGPLNVEFGRLAENLVVEAIRPVYSFAGSNVHGGRWLFSEELGTKGKPDFYSSNLSGEQIQGEVKIISSTWTGNDMLDSEAEFQTLLRKLKILLPDFELNNLNYNHRFAHQASLYGFMSGTKFADLAIASNWGVYLMRVKVTDEVSMKQSFMSLKNAIKGDRAPTSLISESLVNDHFDRIKLAHEKGITLKQLGTATRNGIFYSGLPSLTEDHSPQYGVGSWFFP